MKTLYLATAPVLSEKITVRLDGLEYEGTVFDKNETTVWLKIELESGLFDTFSFSYIVDTFATVELCSGGFIAIPMRQVSNNSDDYCILDTNCTLVEANDLIAEYEEYAEEDY